MTEPTYAEAVSMLENYGDHHEHCGTFVGREYGPGGPCTCGFSEVLARLRGDGTVAATEPPVDARCPVEGCPCGAETEDEHDTRDAE